MNEAAPARRAYWTLDGLRAVGAFLVVMRHVPAYFGPIRVPESFLAVDLFYLVSGFVVAHAYGRRLKAGGGFWTFVKTRLIRLYPLYLFGLALGVIPALIAVIGDPTGWWNPTRLASSIITGLFMIPMFPGLPASGTALDGPVWTLLPELIANFLYAALIRFMNIFVLLAIILVSAALMIYAEFRFGSLDVGYNPTDQWCALARVGFSFFTGVLIFRLFGDRKIKSEVVAWLLVAVLTAGLAFQPSEDIINYYELGVVLIGFPLLLIAAAHFEPGAFTGRIFAFLGLMSYGVYIVHQPLGHLTLATISRVLPAPGDWRGLPFGAVFLAAAIGLAWALDVVYDGPVRKVLRARFLDRRAKGREPLAAPSAGTQ